MEQKKHEVWLVTGAAGFIGSHLAEALLSMGKTVIGIDNFATGRRENISFLDDYTRTNKTGDFCFREIDITDRKSLKDLFAEVGPSHVLHQAALGSVPRSIENPLNSHSSNVDGFINVLDVARLSGVRRLVYASSSSVYGDSAESPKREGIIGECLSPYAATKRINEIYAQVYGKTYGLETVGLRYFNVFGPRQDPNGPYAAVIPRWLALLKQGQGVTIFGDGSTSRDFCYIKNVVQANLQAAQVPSTSSVINGVVNIACGDTTSLLTLEKMLRETVSQYLKIDPLEIPLPSFEEFRKGDIKHSLASIELASSGLNYVPSHTVLEGIRELVKYELDGDKQL